MSDTFSSDAFSSSSFSAASVEDMPATEAFTVVAGSGPYTVVSDNKPFLVE